MLGRAFQLAGVGVACALAIASCGDAGSESADSDGAAAVSTATPTRTTPAATTTAAPAAEPAPDDSTRKFEIDHRSPDGSTAESTIELHEPRRLTDAIADGYSVTCFSGDTSRAAVVPGEIVITSTTPDYTVELTTALTAVHFTQHEEFGRTIHEITRTTGDINDPIVDAEPGDCKQSVGLWGRKGVSEGESLGPIEFGVIFPGYYSPARPRGDKAMLDDWMLSVAPIFRFAETCISGPGVGAGDYIPIGDVDLRTKAHEHDVHVSHLPRCG
jgi:hypothetical protein